MDNSLFLNMMMVSNFSSFLLTEWRWRWIQSFMPYSFCLFNPQYALMHCAISTHSYLQPKLHATLILSFCKSQASHIWMEQKTSTYINLFFSLSVCDMCCVVMWCPYITLCFILICIQPWFVLIWGFNSWGGFFKSCNFWNNKHILL